MGVNGLWDSINDLGEKVSLSKLKGKTVAIDLPGWIVQLRTHNSNATYYLETIFNCVSYLLLLGINPILILDGEPRPLKQKEIENRQKKQGNQKALNNENEIKMKYRFNYLQKKCEKLLNCLGLPCYYSKHEAEALCAILNSKGIVDGIITEDGDSFLYGGKTIYRQFYPRIYSKFIPGINEPSTELTKFTIESLQVEKNVGRNKLIALALLSGCDYNDGGIKHIGPKKSFEFFEEIDDDKVLNRLLDWTNENYEPISECEKQLRKMVLDDTKSKQDRPSEQKFPFFAVQKYFLTSEGETGENVVFNWEKPKIEQIFSPPDDQTSIFKEFNIFQEKHEQAVHTFFSVFLRWHISHDKFNEFEIENITPIQFERSLKIKYCLVIDAFDQSSQEDSNNSENEMDEIVNRFKNINVE